MLTRLYRCLPAGLRDRVYTLFLGRLLAISRNPKLTWQGVCLKQRFKSYHIFFRDKYGIEVGGPSFIFGKRGIFPIYEKSRGIDGCNYASVTVWEGKIQDEVYRYGGVTLGKQYIGEATEVDLLVGEKTYDFVISSNCLEHVANPVKALESWLELLKPEGVILLVVPNKKNNFDHRRPDTTFDHLIEDYTNGVTEEDTTHYEEIVSFHDLVRDSGIESMEAFKQRCLNNKENRCFHHHVFHPDCLVSLFHYLDISILFSCSTEADHVILGQKK